MSGRTGVDPSDLRRINSGVVLRELMSQESPRSTASLVASTGLSRRTVEDIIAELQQEGWADLIDPTAHRPSAGRPARLVAGRPDRALVVAARIDTFAASVAIADLRGTEVASARLPLSDYQDPDRSVADLVTAMRSALSAAGLDIARVRAGVVAAGGVIDEDGVVRRLINAPAWKGFPLAGAVSSAAGFPFTADNDANLAALAEHWQGAASAAPDFVWAILGNRVGMGVLVRGEVHRGVGGRAGELAGSNASINLRGLETSPFGRLTSPIESERVAAIELLDRARNGEVSPLALLDEYVALLMPVLAALAWTVAPPLVVLGGGVEDAADLLLPRLRKALDAAGLDDIAVAVSALGGAAVLRGCMRMALDRIDAALFGPVVVS